MRHLNDCTGSNHLLKKKSKIDQGGETNRKEQKRENRDGRGKTCSLELGRLKIIAFGMKSFFLNLAKTLQLEKIEFRQLKRENIIENKNPTLEFEHPSEEFKKKKNAHS